MATKERDWGAILAGVFFWGLLAAVFAWSPVQSAIANHRVSCENDPISFSTRTVDDPNADLGTSQTTTEGVDGLKKVCKRGDGTLVSTETLYDPIDKVVSEGSKVEPVFIPPPVSSSGCSVTLCNDGSCSFSQGRGTCSWHGGVAQYY